MVDKPLSAAEREQREGFYTFRRIVELRLDPVRGKFDAAHLREINRRIFQDLPDNGFPDVRPGQYREPVPAGMDWVKHRTLEGQQGLVTHVAYSSMDKAAVDQLDKTLAGIDLAAMTRMKTADFVAAIGQLYTALDYVHPFPDGNSRTLREFTRQLAERCGFNIDWERFNRSPNGRNILYVARDLSVNELALPNIKHADTRRLVTFTQDQLAGNRALPDLLRDAVLPGRALAFRNMREADAMIAFPELRPAYDTLRTASVYSLSKFPNDRDQQREFQESVRAHIQQKLDQGEKTDFTPQKSASRGKQPPTRDRER